MRILTHACKEPRLGLAGSWRCRKLLVWSAAGNASPDKFHTTHDAITSTHFANDDRLVVLGTQVCARRLPGNELACSALLCPGTQACAGPWPAACQPRWWLCLAASGCSVPHL